MDGRIALFLLLFTSSLTTHAATPYKRSLSVKKNQYATDAVFTGGEAGRGAEILGVRRTYSGKAKIERVIVDLAEAGVKVHDRTPYFQVNVDSTSRRVILDVSQLRSSKVSEPQLRQLFAKSPLVKDASITLDPEDKAATIVLETKQPVRVEVFQLKGKKKPGRVVLDLKPLKS